MAHIHDNTTRSHLRLCDIQDAHILLQTVRQSHLQLLQPTTPEQMFFAGPLLKSTASLDGACIVSHTTMTTTDDLSGLACGGVQPSLGSLSNSSSLIRVAATNRPSKFGAQVIERVEQIPTSRRRSSGMQEPRD
ncbi:hypothetical protein FRB95_009821 [Tulasnella sp. JGI-2019a]|nr:hypothetical protein FRB95_009821 [Tulasnella sp. JGI-2019a]